MMVLWGQRVWVEFLSEDGDDRDKGFGGTKIADRGCTWGLSHGQREATERRLRVGETLDRADWTWP